MAKAYLTSKCAGISFPTMREWIDYKDKNGDVLFVSGKYNWNIHDVCVNFDKLRINRYAEVHYAEWKGKWYWGYDWQLKTMGGCSPTIVGDNRVCNSMNEAISKATDYILDILKRELPKDADNCKSLYSTKDDLEIDIKEEQQPQQLTLF